MERVQEAPGATIPSDGYNLLLVQLPTSGAMLTLLEAQ